MTLVIETGIGTRDANSYITTAFVTTYLTNRNRQTENSWDSLSSTIQDAAVVEATDYIELRFRELFRGRRFYEDISNARAAVEYTGNPSDAETLTVSTQVYTYVTTLSGAADEILIGDTVADTIMNTIAAISATGDEGETFGTGTVANEDVTASQGIDDTLWLFAVEVGTAGNSIPLATSSGVITLPALLVGGSNVSYPQPLSFPRMDLFDDDFVTITGIPLLLMNASAEYAVRAAATVDGVDLAPDPTVDDRGGVVTSISEKVGPIATATTYLAGTATGQALRPYPAADRLLNCFLKSSSGGTFR